MPTIWLQNDSWKHLDLVSKELLIGLSSLSIQDKNLQQVFPKHFSNVQESKVQHHIQRKVEYGRLMGNFKKALNYSIANNDQKNLNVLILLYIARKERKWEAEALLVIIEDPVPNNIVKLADGRIYDADNIKDPVVYWDKGKQPTKRLKAFTKENNKAAASNIKHANISNKEKGVEVISTRKCCLCHETEHYAPKCPNQED
ncbi:hypothetical protein C2G38_2040113 [Gigaspora rosea]|uniref:Uncharacterized protein n=1 Tax=Gigaspora rosea TaxID=44941 RepID=A0A397V0K4_9GLOM|nr:hypothetical protein C2G38_2040113 [Gigaspora rosea]